MLVLTRRPGQSIMIGNDVTVTVLEIRNDQVRIGVAAPRSVQVHREEIYEQIARENAAAVEGVKRPPEALRARPPRRRQ
ncbi:MAG TPA: carbon storage regulator CsrA [Euzebyales bacterium]|nr:carbon storage regulator CsrA [Euzebyales bacterium]